MLEMNIGKNGNIFELPQDKEAVCVTTNDIVKSNGKAVMGAGIAKEADQLFHLSNLLGKYLKQYGNRAFNLGNFTRLNLNNSGIPIVFTVFSFPTKYDWKDDSDITLICKSAEQLMQMCDKFCVTKCYLPPVGCGCGNLNYQTTVKPWLEQILDDRFVVVFKQ